MWQATCKRIESQVRINAYRTKRGNRREGLHFVCEVIRNRAFHGGTLT